MQTIYFITHPNVLIDPAIPVQEWRLSPYGQERMARMLVQPWVNGVGSIWSSSEQKARDGAKILSEYLRLSVTELAQLGENDRSATGYLPSKEFEAVANQFFAHPSRSIRGWETAADAQRRVVAAIDHIIAASSICHGDIAIVAHGGVGTLLLCHLRGEAIGREHDQPPNNGGNYFAFDTKTRKLQHGWRPIDAKYQACSQD